MSAAARPATTAVQRRHLLTVAVEDYYQVSAFAGLISASHWYRFERRVEANTNRALELLDALGVRATFFVLGSIAEEMPELVRAIADRGHEVASKGWSHRSIHGLDAAAFRDESARAREALERAAGLRIWGHRIARGRLGLGELWALDVLAELGFSYDSSFYPLGRSLRDQPWRRFPHVHEHAARRLHELPLATREVAGFLVPAAGGAYLRQLPRLVRGGLAAWERATDTPCTLYFHVWELDPELPRISAASRFTRLRQYRNVERMPDLLRELVAGRRFAPVREYLALPVEHLAVTAPAPVPAPAAVAAAGGSGEPVTVVVPCFNEERVLPYLANTLARLAERLAPRWDLRFVLVDDGSQDETWKVLESTFGGSPRHRLVRHEHNRGVAAAILTGIAAAETEVVCSIDCDCTYDPEQLRELLPLLGPDVAMVTASPYHPAGAVRNVPAWRLALSRNLSRLYRRVLHQKLHTYTSCFRVYRRSALAGLPLRETGFLGVTELLGALDLRGERIVEAPAVLEARMLGSSKMKVGRTIAGHLRLLARLAAARWATAPIHPAAADPEEP